MARPKRKGAVHPFEKLSDLVRQIENLRPELLEYIHGSFGTADHNLRCEVINLGYETRCWLSTLDRVKELRHG